MSTLQCHNVPTLPGQVYAARALLHSDDTTQKDSQPHKARSVHRTSDGQRLSLSSTNIHCEDYSKAHITALPSVTRLIYLENLITPIPVIRMSPELLEASQDAG